jgi:hypothetical protein
MYCDWFKAAFHSLEEIVIMMRAQQGAKVLGHGLEQKVARLGQQGAKAQALESLQREDIPDMCSPRHPHRAGGKLSGTANAFHCNHAKVFRENCE